MIHVDMEVPQYGWFIRNNPIKMDDLRVPLFVETPIYRTSKWDFHPFMTGMNDIYNDIFRCIEPVKMICLGQR